MTKGPRSDPPVGFGSNDFPKVRFAVQLVAAFGVAGDPPEPWKQGLGPDDPVPEFDPFAGMPAEVRDAVAQAAGYLAEGFRAERENKVESNRAWKEQIG